MDVIYQESIDRINISIVKMVTVLRDAMPWTLLPTFRSNFLLPPSTLIAKAVGSFDMLLNIYHATLRLVAGLSPRRLGFNPGATPFWICGKKKWCRYRFFSKYFGFFPLIIAPQMPHIHISFICHGQHTTLATDSLVK